MADKENIKRQSKMCRIRVGISEGLWRMRNENVWREINCCWKVLVLTTKGCDFQLKNNYIFLHNFPRLNSAAHFITADIEGADFPQTFVNFGWISLKDNPPKSCTAKTRLHATWANKLKLVMRTNDMCAQVGNVNCWL